MKTVDSMNQTLTQSFHLAFLLFGFLAVLNAYLNKWGPAVAMLFLCMVAFLTGLLLGLGLIWASAALVIIGAMAAIYAVKMRQSPSSGAASEGKSPAEISARMLDEMNRNVAERKGRK